MQKKKTALFGGTFDPIHIGHITVADAAHNHIKAEKTIFVPAKKTALKTHYPTASNEHRLNMVRLAIKDFGNFQVCDYELNKNEPDYTIETVRYFRGKYGGDVDFYWLIGADCLEELHLWYKTEQLLEQCRICVMYRAGFDKPDFSKFSQLWGKEKIKKLQDNVIETPIIDASSTRIRQALAEGKDVSSVLDSRVLEYIKQNKLYGA